MKTTKPRKTPAVPPVAFALILIVIPALTGCMDDDDRVALAPERIAWTVTPNSTIHTTMINIVLDEPIENLTSEEIHVTTVHQVVGGRNVGGLATVGELTGHGTEWFLAVSDVRGGEVSVWIERDDTVRVMRMEIFSANWIRAAFDPAAGVIRLRFDCHVGGLDAGAIVVADGTGSVTVGELTSDGEEWRLAVDVESAGVVSVSIGAPGYVRGPMEVAVWKPGAGEWAQVSAGYVHTAAIKNDGSLWTWGNNWWWQLGVGEVGNQNIVQVGADNDWAYVVAGRGHTVAIRTDGSLWAWGDNTFGQLGDGTGGEGVDSDGFAAWVEQRSTRNTPIRIGAETDWIAVIAGAAFTMATRKGEGKWLSWGMWLYFPHWARSMEDFEIIRDFGNIPARQHTWQSQHWISMSASESRAKAIGADGSIRDWWEPSQWAEIMGTIEEVSTPQGHDWASVSVGHGFSAGIKTDGSLWVWGRNNDREQLGDDPAAGERYAARIGADNDWISVSAGDRHAAAIRMDGSLWVWGAAEMLGNGATSDSRVPVRIGRPLEGWVSASVGTGHTAADANGSLWTWGSNMHGQLGFGPDSARGSHLSCPSTSP